MSVWRDHRGGQVSSDVPWWISTGSVTRSKKVRAEASFQNCGFFSGDPCLAMIR